jgi:hypothetical protein
MLWITQSEVNAFDLGVAIGAELVVQFGQLICNAPRLVVLDPKQLDFDFL